MNAVARAQLTFQMLNLLQTNQRKAFSNGLISDSFQRKLDVRQGEYLSPFLFAMYVNDMEDASTFRAQVFINRD